MTPNKQYDDMKFGLIGDKQPSELREKLEEIIYDILAKHDNNRTYDTDYFIDQILALIAPEVEWLQKASEVRAKDKPSGKLAKRGKHGKD